MSEIIAYTDRLYLRMLEEDDEELIFQILSESPSIKLFQNNAELANQFRKANWEEVTGPSIVNALIFVKGTNDFVGKVCMQFVDKPMPELGIDILKKHQNKGFGPEVIKAFCNWYMKKHSLPAVKVRISKDNSHSIHIFEKLGAEFIGSTSYVSEASLDYFKKALPDANLDELSQDSVREYLLHCQ